MLYVCWGILALINMVDGVNLLRGKGRWMKQIVKILEGRKQTEFRLILGGVYAGFGVCFGLWGLSGMIPVNSPFISRFLLILAVIMLAASKKYTGKFFF